MDPSKSAGYDSVPTKLLKLTAHEISASLACLFNASFRTGCLPQDWRDSAVTPVFKKGNASLLTNYRPISLLSVVSKVQERVVFEQLSKHIDPHIPTHQSGFRRQDGTELQLSRLVHEISEARDAGKTVMSCFFDLSKAFDRVWHDGLLAKLSHFGAHGAAYNWFAAYLNGRRQRVKIENSFSSWLAIPAGVPQGSVLGPLLFLIYTIDLPAACINESTVCSQFADDTALITAANSLSSTEASLQSAVSSAGEWLRNWHLLVNASKTVVISFHHKNRPPQRIPRILLYDTVLSVVPQHRHLGVIIQQNLKWDKHIHTVLAKSSSKLGQFRRYRCILTANAMTYLYKSYIRPILEYASTSYSNLPCNLHDSLERFQRKAARICLRLPLFTPVNHSTLLHNTKLPTLSSRRKFKLLLLAHSIRFKYAPPHIQNIPITYNHSPYALRQNRMFSLPTTRTDRHRDSPIYAALHEFNKLPEEFRGHAGKIAFKNATSQFIQSSIFTCSDHPACLFSTA